MSKVMDLHAELGIKTDRRSIAAAEREMRRVAREAQREADRAAKAAHRAQTTALTRAQRNASALARVERGQSGGFARFNARAGSALSMGALGGLGAAAAGGYLFSRSARDAFKFDEAMTRLVVSSDGAMGSLSRVQDQILRVSEITGVAKEELLQGAHSFVALTGDGKSAAAGLETFAKVSKATGAQMKDIAGTAASLTQNFAIDPADYEKAFSVLIAGGKKGSIELEHLAGLLAELGPQASLFAGAKGIGGMSELAAGMQLARQGFGSAEEASTGMRALMTSLISKATMLRKKGGVEVFETGPDGVKRARNMLDIVEEIGRSKLGRDPELLAKALGSDEALKAYLAVTKIPGAWRELSRETSKATDLAKDYTAVQQSASAQVKKSWNEVKVAISEIFTPERVRAIGMMASDALRGAKDVVGGAGIVAGALFDDGQSNRLKRTQRSDKLDDELLKGRTLEEIAAAEPGFLEMDLRGEAKRRLEENRKARERSAAKNAMRPARHAAMEALSPAYALARMGAKADLQARQNFGLALNPIQGAARMAAAQFRKNNIGGNTVNINVNANGAGSADIASAVKRAVQQILGDKLTHAAAAVVGGG